MKIRTLNDLQDAVDKEMAWRKHELSAVRSNVATARNHAKDTAIRAGIALLYAHWEGGIKNIATYYLEYVAMQGLPYGQLKPNFLAISIKNDLTAFTGSNKSTIHTAVVSDILQKQADKARIPVDGVIKTASNLNSSVFVEIMATIGLDDSQYQSSYKLIDEVLLNKRNAIAHGERLEALSLDEARYFEIHEKVLNLLIQFSANITNAAALKLYLEDQV